MIEKGEIERMSIAERLETIEEIWQSLYHNSDQVPSPDWHKDVLADRKARAERGESNFLTLDQLRTRFPNHDRGSRQSN
jgi:putative addiction module component (TIGR02574 family)